MAAQRRGMHGVAIKQRRKNARRGDTFSPIMAAAASYALLPEPAHLVVPFNALVLVMLMLVRSCQGLLAFGDLDLQFTGHASRRQSSQADQQLGHLTLSLTLIRQVKPRPDTHTRHYQPTTTQSKPRPPTWQHQRVFAQLAHQHSVCCTLCVQAPCSLTSLVVQLNRPASDLEARVCYESWMPSCRSPCTALFSPRWAQQALCASRPRPPLAPPLSAWRQTCPLTTCWRTSTRALCRRFSPHRLAPLPPPLLRSSLQHPMSILHLLNSTWTVSSSWLVRRRALRCLRGPSLPSVNLGRSRQTRSYLKSSIRRPPRSESATQYQPRSGGFLCNCSRTSRERRRLEPSLRSNARRLQNEAVRSFRRRGNLLATPSALLGRVLARHLARRIHSHRWPPTSVAGHSSKSQSPAARRIDLEARLAAPLASTRLRRPRWRSRRGSKPSRTSPSKKRRLVSCSASAAPKISRTSWARSRPT